jgi:hypothetical protein
VTRPLPQPILRLGVFERTASTRTSGLSRLAMITSPPSSALRINFERCVFAWWIVAGVIVANLAKLVGHVDGGRGQRFWLGAVSSDDRDHRSRLQACSRLTFAYVFFLAAR